MADVDLSQLDFFKSFNEEQLQKVRALGEEVGAEAGALLTEQGRVGQEAYLIVDGEAEVIVAGERVATLSSGSLVGEMALIDVRPRSATVRALTQMDLLRFDSRRFKDLLETMPETEAARLAEHSRQTREQNLAD